MYTSKYLILILLFFTSFFQIGYGQSLKDSLHLNVEETSDIESIVIKSNKEKREERRAVWAEEERSTKKAALLSLGVPGLGQIYNKKFWKLSIFYTAIATSTFFVGWNATRLREANALLRQSFEINGVANTAILAQRNYHRRLLEISSVVAASMYLWNILDAFVDAHLHKFDVNDDLSLAIEPKILTVNNGAFPGVGLTLRL